MKSSLKKLEEKTKNDSNEPEGEAKENSKSFQISPALVKKIKDANAVPLPGKDEFWFIESLISDAKNKRKILRIFKKKSLKADELINLRKGAIQSPGVTRTKIQKLKKQYPNDPSLFMLSAISTNGMLRNSSNQNEVVKGLKFAAREAAIALVSDEVSIYNSDSFFTIYFNLLNRLKRHQLKVYEEVRADPRLESSKTELVSSMRIVDQLASEQSKITGTLNNLKKKLKSSHYITIFDLKSIREAISRVTLGNPKEKSKVGTASEMIVFIYAFMGAFSRIPILSPLVDQILQILPDSNQQMLLRKISINTMRNFSRFKLVQAEGDRNQMAKLGKFIMKDNMAGIQKLSGQSLYQGYETDPFFNMAIIAHLTTELYQGNDYQQILATAIEAMETVIKRDMSKNHIFTESANNHLRKLTKLKESAAATV